MRRSCPRLLAAGALGLALICGSAAHASQVLFDDFNSENGGAAAVDYGAFTNWGNGLSPVDLVANGASGFTCLGDTGSCVDLYGTTGAGSIYSKNEWSFAKGDLVTLSFYISGAQGDDSNALNKSEDFFAGFFFPGGATIDSFTKGGAYGSSVSNPGAVFFAEPDVLVADHTPFADYTLSFIAGSSGNLVVELGTENRNFIVGQLFSAYQNGPVLDNVSLSISPVPEPAAWAMLTLGLGMIGFSLRRRSEGLEPAA